MKLLDYIISVSNKSGSIPPAPNALKNLKGSIENVPFNLLTPSMSGLFTQANLLQGVQLLLQQMGNLNNIGNFQQLLSQFNNGSITTQQLLDALGNAGSMSAVMMTFGKENNGNS
jgi:hypothetical protein